MPNSQNYPLETERLVLRLPEIDDATELARLISPFDVAKTMLTVPHPYTFENAKEWIQSVYERDDDSSVFRYLMIRKEDKQLIGGCGFQVKPEHEKTELGYWVGMSYWGYGYATEATKRLIQFCFEMLNLNRVEAQYFAENEASRRVQEKAGMTFEGLMRQSLIRHIPSKKHRIYHDVGICAILRSDWEANKG